MKKSFGKKNNLILGAVFIVLCLVLAYFVSVRISASDRSLESRLPNQLQEPENNEAFPTLEVQSTQAPEENPDLSEHEAAEAAEPSATHEEEAVESYPDSAHLTPALRGSEIMLVKQGDPYIEPGAFAVDDRFGIIGDYEVSGVDAIDTSVAGDYLIEYTLKSENALAEISRTVRVLSPESFGANSAAVPVMMYHCVYTAANPPASLNSNYILWTASLKNNWPG